MWKECWILLLNRANYLIKKVKISSGGLSATVVDARIVFKLAIDHGAAAIVMAHNHPSGNTEPSKADILLTEKLLHGGKLLDLTIVDHLIFTDTHYFSFSDADLVL